MEYLLKISSIGNEEERQVAGRVSVHEREL